MDIETRKRLFKGGRFVSPMQRSDIRIPTEERLKTRRQEISTHKYWEQRETKRRTAKEILYIEIAAGNDDSMEKIDKYLEKKGLLEISSGDRPQFFGAGSQIEYRVDDVSRKKLNQIYDYLSKFGTKVRYDIYEKSW